MFVPEARNDPTSSKTLVLGSVQDSGPPLLSAQAGGYVVLFLLANKNKNASLCLTLLST